MLIKSYILSKNIKLNRNKPVMEKLPVLKSVESEIGSNLEMHSSHNLFLPLHIEANLEILSDRAKGKVWLEHDTDDIAEWLSLDGRKKIIHVNQNHLINNKSVGCVTGRKLKPLITIKAGGLALYADHVKILGDSKISYYTKPLSCGAEVVIETYSDIVTTNPIHYKGTK